MTPAQAIKRECGSCGGNVQKNAQNNCPTKICKLHPDVTVTPNSSLQRIRQHCLDCAAAEDYTLTARKKAVEECTGKLGRNNGNNFYCWLHPYRFGKNPDKQRAERSPAQKVNDAKLGLRRSTTVPNIHSPDVVTDSRIDDLT